MDGEFKNEMETEDVKQTDAPGGKREMMRLCIICILTFLLAAVWNWAAITVAAQWFPVINWLLHDSVRMIDDQPLWGKILQLLVGNSPRIGLVACAYLWGFKKRQWVVPLMFLLGILAYEAYLHRSFIEMMRDFG